MFDRIHQWTKKKYSQTSFMRLALLWYQSQSFFTKRKPKANIPDEHSCKNPQQSTKN
jgi:hypothetical protein